MFSFKPYRFFFEYVEKLICLTNSITCNDGKSIQIGRISYCGCIRTESSIEPVFLSKTFMFVNFSKLKLSNWCVQVTIWLNHKQQIEHGNYWSTQWHLEERWTPVLRFFKNNKIIFLFVMPSIVYRFKLRSTISMNYWVWFVSFYNVSIQVTFIQNDQEKSTRV